MSSDFHQLHTFSQMRTSLKGKNFLPHGRKFFPLREVSCGMEVTKGGKDQQSIQSSTTPDPVYHMGK